jgi:glutamine synthetase
MKFKYVIKNTAWAQRQDRDLHAEADLRRQRLGHARHQSLWKDGEPLFYDELGYAGLSDMARYYIGGLLAHAPALLAFTNPTVNSYHRLVPGYEAPVNLVYSQRNRSACIRIPITGNNPKAKRIEFRVPGPLEQPVPGVLGDADGRPRRHQEQDRAGGPVDKDLYELPPDEAAEHPAGARPRCRGDSTHSRRTTTS